MPLLVHLLQYILLNMSQLIQWLLFLIGTLLILIPLYQVVLNNEKSLLKVSRACASRLGMHRFVTIQQEQPQQQQIEAIPFKKSSTLSLSLSSFTVEPASQVCLLRNNNTTHYISGLVNTGNSCFLNSVLQSLSALPKLQLYLDEIAKSTGGGGHKLPVTRSLQKTLKLLSIPSDKSFQPTEIVSAMASNRCVVNREQQDAQELFQLISGELDTENGLAQKQQSGFRDLLKLKRKKTVDNPFTGLLANRLSCTECGYTEAIRHFSFNNVQLTLPNSEITTLDACLKQLTTMEYLNDVTCRKCTFTDTVAQLTTEINALKSSEKMEKLHCLEKIRKDIESRLEQGRIAEEDDHALKGLLSKVTRNCSKQAMFAKPPKVLCLHIARSSFTPTGEILKNTCHIQFPQELDLAPYCTNGTLNTQQPHQPISIPNSALPVKYRLMSAIVHYGSHNYGHFIAYKRRLVAEKCSCVECKDTANIFSTHDSDWYKTSDERVDLCSVDEVLNANPYMLLYELIDQAPVENSKDTVDTTNVPVTLPSTLLADSETDTDTEEEDMTKIPLAPPSSPNMLPLQLGQSIVVSSSASSCATIPKQRRRKNSLWQKTSPVAIY